MSNPSSAVPTSVVAKSQGGIGKRLCCMPCVYVWTTVLPAIRTAWRLYYRVTFFASLVFTIIYMLPPGGCDNGIHNMNSAQQYIQIRSRNIVAAVTAHFRKPDCSVPDGVPPNAFQESVATVLAMAMLSSEAYEEFFWNGSLMTTACNYISFPVSSEFLALSYVQLWFCVSIGATVISVIMAPIITAADLVACAYSMAFGNPSAPIVILLGTAVLSLLLFSPFFSASSKKHVLVVRRVPSNVVSADKKDQ